MIKQNRKNIIKNIIKYFSRYSTKVPKILIQKTVYFFNFIGFDTSFRFQGDQYGPFSKDIVDVIDEMEISQEIKINGEFYIINENFDYDYQEFHDLKEKMQIYYEKILNKDISFNNIEQVGTIMFIMANHEYGNIENVIYDVERWKPEKYSKEKIIEIIYRISKNIIK